ncbi:MAG: transketolase [Acidobacteriaceae bacterium]
MKTVEELEKLANEIRQDVIKMLVHAKSGHSAGSLGTADIFTALYFAVLNIDSKNPQDENRDRFVLSAGHINPVWYATLAHAGFIPHNELLTLRQLGSRLQGHPDHLVLPGAETSSGSLGQGLSQAAGIALAGKLDGKAWRVYCLMSDGEQQEGQTWEAAMFSGSRKLNNLTAIIDRNNIQIDGHTEDVMPIEPLRKKYESFNWQVLEVDGHDIEAIIQACDMSRTEDKKPTLIICKTIPGKGVDYMEYHYEWHGSPPGSIEPEGAPSKNKQAEEALRQLRTLGGRIDSGHY